MDIKEVQLKYFSMAKFLNPVPVMDRNLIADKRSNEEVINDFLSSRQGLLYLRTMYPNLSVEEAIAEYKKAFYTELSI